MDTEPYLSILHHILVIQLNPITPGIIVGFISIFVLLIGSALVSGSEVAYFSLQPFQVGKLREMNTKGTIKVMSLLGKPEKLLATILISNNFINVGIVIISTFITTSIFDFSEEPVLAFLIQVVVVTFLLLVFGEIIPKLYANQNALRFSIFMSHTL
ncbi:MAG: DUF21 domain-containing protein, partial [Bacteroidales bacterium]